MKASEDGRFSRAASRKAGILGPLLALAVALPLAVGCSGTATVKGPAGTGIDLTWDTTRLQDMWYELEEFIELNLEYLGPQTLISNPAASELARDNIRRATALKDKIAARAGLPQTTVN